MFWLKMFVAVAIVILGFAMPFQLLGFSLPTALLISLTWLVGGVPAGLILALLAALLGDAARLLTAFFRNSAHRQSYYPYGR